jgi:hypothetical protein
MVVLLSLIKVNRNRRAKAGSSNQEIPNTVIGSASGPDSTITLNGSFKELTVGIMKRRR